MLDTLKEIGKGTLYEFDKHRIKFPLPSTHGNLISEKPSIIENEWFDKSGQHYYLKDKTLFITAKDYFQEDGYNIVDYINSIPKDSGITINLKINSSPNEVAGFNILCNLLSTYPTSNNIILNITEMKFNENINLYIDNLPDNVKITSMLDVNSKEENYIFSSESFENWALNCSEAKFKLLLDKLTINSRNRIYRLREISLNFYRFFPDSIKTANDEEKIKYIYNWCCNNIKYDMTAVNQDGTLKETRRDSQDPIITFDRRCGVCEGRAKLLKALLNNYYNKIHCFLVKGMSGRLQHTWNEILLENGSILDLDISKQANRIADNHDELEIFSNTRIKNIIIK